MGIRGGWVLHGPTFAGLKISVKVTCHNLKIYFCGKRLGWWDRENLVQARVSGCGFGDSRNGNGDCVWELHDSGSFPQAVRSWFRAREKALPHTRKDMDHAASEAA